MKRVTFILALAAVSAFASADLNILVYDHDTENHFAATAAQEVSSSVSVGDSDTFNALLTGSSWDVVLVDAPGTGDSANWSGLRDYISGGGRVVMSYWLWHSDLALASAFGIHAAEEFSLTGETLYAHQSSLFGGVTMPNSDWRDVWGVDGGLFTDFDGVSLGGLSESGDSVIVQGNQGRTIAWALFDEAGTTWQTDGSAVQLWKNSIQAVGAPVPEPATMAALGLGALAVLRRRRKNG